ncbi:hypothetical protein [Chromobacterium sphagni]|uniref:Uncharacterized protein n=1 Tax=Chromobacterium sphagni TaxID=1903179 RepID=A0A1S1X418_9NEIS|nr:hypothetical protein [Chromobacterium sphagni]OHX14188.1 hypothetical protein BI347_12225 [Chromobacterium sphagni]OHX20391.1 hypothetical protein BI344_07890 [Chromobacterium sphagni]
MADVAAALEAYLQLIARLGAAQEVVEQRRALLLRLLARLSGLPRTVETYQAVVEVFVADCPLQERVLAMSCCREFYCFWLNDMKKVVEITSRSGFSLFNPAILLAGTFDELVDVMQRRRFRRFPPSLGLYLGKLFEDGHPDEVIRQRGILLKALLFLLDPHPFDSTSYRMAVDGLLLHLQDPADRQLLLPAVREYFPYWQSFPFARQRVGTDKGESASP